jgi:putative ABC transport system substrate-binding protein
LKEAGFSDGQSVAIEYRWAEGHYDRLPALAAELVSHHVAVLYATGGEPAAIAAKSATALIPIVFLIGDDPVKVGLVESFNRPGGNVTGMSLLTSSLEEKRIGLLRELVPRATTFAILLNPNNPNADGQLHEVREATARLGVQFIVGYADTDVAIERAFANVVRERADVLLVGADPFFNTTRNQFVALAARHHLPAIYQFSDAAVAGGLMSYGANLKDAYRQVGIYVARILKGAKPADLPVLQPITFEFVINLKTAKALGLNVPSSLLALADEVIE